MAIRCFMLQVADVAAFVTMAASLLGRGALALAALLLTQLIWPGAFVDAYSWLLCAAVHMSRDVCIVECSWTADALNSNGSSGTLTTGNKLRVGILHRSKPPVPLNSSDVYTMKPTLLLLALVSYKNGRFPTSKFPTI